VERPEWLDPKKKAYRRKRRWALPQGSRGDWTPLELFFAGIRGWDAGMQRILGGQFELSVRA
jgi:hypothetical protein